MSISQIGKKLYLLENKLCCPSWHFLESSYLLLYFLLGMKVRGERSGWDTVKYHMLLQTGLVAGSATRRRTSTSQGKCNVLTSCSFVRFAGGTNLRGDQGQDCHSEGPQWYGGKGQQEPSETQEGQMQRPAPG